MTVEKEKLMWTKCESITKFIDSDGRLVGSDISDICTHYDYKTSDFMIDLDIDCHDIDWINDDFRTESLKRIRKNLDLVKKTVEKLFNIKVKPTIGYDELRLGSNYRFVIMHYKIDQEMFETLYVLAKMNGF